MAAIVEAGKKGTDPPRHEAVRQHPRQGGEDQQEVPVAPGQVKDEQPTGCHEQEIRSNTRFVIGYSVQEKVGGEAKLPQAIIRFQEFSGIARRFFWNRQEKQVKRWNNIRAELKTEAAAHTGTDYCGRMEKGWASTFTN